MTLGDIIRMEEMVKKLTAEREAAKAEGAAEERAKIVAWLRDTIFNMRVLDIPAAIEAKEHLK